MKKLVNGDLVDMSAEEEKACLEQRAQAVAEALEHVKKSIIERIDAKMDELQRQTWMADTKEKIRAAKSVLAVKEIFDSIQWPHVFTKPGTFSAPQVNRTVIEVRGDGGSGGGSSSGSGGTGAAPLRETLPYDDAWIREQMSALAEALRALDQHGSQFVTDIVARLAEVERRLEELERLPDAVAFLPPQANGKAQEPSYAPGDWKAAMGRVEAAEAEEEGVPPAELPPIELMEPPGFEPEMYAPDPIPPPVPRTIVMAEQKTITDSWWGRAEIAYQVAIQAKNRSVLHRGLLIGPAERRGVSVDALVDHIIRERDETVQRVMSEY